MKYFKDKKYTTFLKIIEFSFILIFGILFSSNQALAVCPDGTTVSPCPDAVSTGTNITTLIKNPLGDNIQDIPSFIQILVTIVLIVGIPIIALAIIYSGFLFVTAQGNAEKLTKAKSALIYSLIGAALLLGAFVIADAIGKTISEIKG